MEQIKKPTIITIANEKGGVAYAKKYIMQRNL